MRNIEKYIISLILINIVMILNSCTEYRITWRNYSSYSNAEVVFTSQNNESVKLRLNSTSKFKVSAPIEFINLQHPNECDLYVYPFFQKDVESEIFLFDMQILYRKGETVKVADRQNVEGYYAKFYIDELCYTVISKDAELTITEPQELKSIKEVLANEDKMDYTYLDSGRNDYNGVVFCGYIVASKFDNTMHFLGP